MGVDCCRPGLQAAHFFARLLSCALVLALALVMVPVSTAQAYYSFGTVGVSAGASSLSVQAGSSVSTSISVSPSSDSQTLGCGMAKCPQVCTNDDVIAAGYTCFDVNGQCTCAGPSYSTYYPALSASSSNSGVASAYVSGSTLVVTGNSAGTATITVTASLRQWETNTTSVQVTVSSPAPSSTSGDSSSSASSSSSSSASSDSAASSGSSAQAVPSKDVAVPEAAQSTDSRDDALNETVVETVAGKVYFIENNGYLVTSEALGAIVGTEDQVNIWSGPSSDKPNYSWTFSGNDVSEDAAKADFDPTITISSLGTGNVSNIMKQASDGLVLEFAHEGSLPGRAVLYIRVDDTYADGTALNLYCFDKESQRFELQQESLTVGERYVSFSIDHCSTWALSKDDLTAYQVEETNTPGAIRADKQDFALQEEVLDPAILVGVCAGVIVVVAIAAFFVLVRRRAKRGLPADTQGNAAMQGSAEEQESSEAE